MKKLALLSLISILFISCKNDNISIEGKSNIFPDETEVTLFDISLKEMIAEATIKNGSFKLTGHLKDSIPNIYWLKIKTEKSVKTLNIMLEPNESITISNIGNDYPNDLKIGGSKHSSQFYEYYKLIEPLDKEREVKLTNYFKIKNKTLETDSIYWGKNGLITVIDNKYEQQTKSFISKNYTTYFGLSTLSRYCNSFSKNELELFYANLNKELKSSRYGKFINIYLNTENLEIGDKYVNFEALNIDDEKKKFSDFVTNDFNLLNFSTYHCVPSMQTLEELFVISKKNSDKLTIINYYVDADIKGFETFSKFKNKNWSSIRNNEGRYNTAYALYRITSTPTLFLFDKRGILIKKYARFDSQSKSEIEKIISN